MGYAVKGKKGFQTTYSNDVMMSKKMVLAIIDKYKAESEET